MTTNGLKRKYGFWTATAMVVGIVIGSGVFFKADDVLKAAGGSLPKALFSWFIGGMIMVATAYVFAKMATKISKSNGVADYFEEAYGQTAGYLVAWFVTVVYFPSLTAILGWVAANYSASLIGNNDILWPLAFIYIIVFFAINLLSPWLAGVFQVSATIIKLIPLALIAVAGTYFGLTTGQTIESFANIAESVSSGGRGIAVATLATAFAYEGWIVATSINAEIKDSKKNLPKALVAGTVIITIIYMIYYLGISGVLSNEEILKAGDAAPVQVISRVFGGNIAGTLLTVFVIISCLGTLNGLAMGASRGMHSIAARGIGPIPSVFKVVNSKTNSPINSGVIGLMLSLIWFAIWYGNFHSWWGEGKFMDISELPIAYLYTFYTLLHIWVIRTFTELNVFSRFFVPSCAILGSLFIIYGGIQKDLFIQFSIILVIIIGFGFVVMKSNK